MKVRRVGLVLALGLTAGSAAAEPGVSHDTRRMVVLHRSRLPAAPELADALRMLAQAGSRGDRLGVVEYGAEVAVRMPSTSLGHRQALGRLEAAISTEPQTRPGARAGPAVLAALQALGPRVEGALDLVWVLPGADGTADPTAVDAAIDAARVRGARVHVLGAPGSTLSDVLVRLTAQTRGSTQVRLTEVALHHAVLELIARSRGADRLPVRAGGFWVDEQAESLLVALDREPDEVARLVGPDEVAHTFARPAGVTWHRLTGYDLVEIDAPMPGLWRADQPAGLDRAKVVVRRSPLRLVLDVEPSPATLEAPARLRVRFEEHARPVVSYARLKDMEVGVRVVAPEGEPRPLDLTRVPGGWYEGYLTPGIPGTHEVLVAAESPDVVRRHAFTFTAERQCFDVAARWSEADVAVDVQLRPDCDDLTEVRVRARFDGRDESGVLAPGDWHAFADGGGGTLAAAIPRSGPGELVVEARAIDGKSPRRFGLPTISAPRKPPGLSALDWASRLLIANIPLLLLPLLWAHRRQLHNLEVASHA